MGSQGGLACYKAGKFCGKFHKMGLSRVSAKIGQKWADFLQEGLVRGKILQGIFDPGSRGSDLHWVWDFGHFWPQKWSKMAKFSHFWRGLGQKPRLDLTWRPRSACDRRQRRSRTNCVSIHNFLRSVSGGHRPQGALFLVKIWSSKF